MGVFRGYHDSKQSLSTNLVDSYETIPPELIGSFYKMMLKFYDHSLLGGSSIPLLSKLLAGMPVFYVEIKKIYSSDEGMTTKEVIDSISEDEMNNFLTDIRKILDHIGLMYYDDVDSDEIKNSMYIGVW